ncbi:hypothetical protein SAMN05444352_12924 [Pseudomonas japonica]|uniref:Uncharacterized protein n=1 Tax=Pseudomonas japonica TaxID=256466 RepID=A0A239KVH1_9PSED|nr:hypothetical protein SAMN05444352_12924 [Pseudomonas japonica]
MTVVAVARATVMIAAYAMIAGRLSSVITCGALAISTLSAHATRMPTAVSTSATTTTTTFGMGGSNRRDISGHPCRYPERQCTSKDSNQGFSHLYSPPEARGGS